MITCASEARYPEDANDLEDGDFGIDGRSLWRRATVQDRNSNTSCNQSQGHLDTISRNTEPLIT
eukprot:2339519-Pleurochrysis_carterae.AAC.1